MTMIAEVDTELNLQHLARPEMSFHGGASKLQKAEIYMVSLIFKKQLHDLFLITESKTSQAVKELSLSCKLLTLTKRTCPSVRCVFRSTPLFQQMDSEQHDASETQLMRCTHRRVWVQCGRTFPRRSSKQEYIAFISDINCG